jgi:hypothetical protein
MTKKDFELIAAALLAEKMRVIDSRTYDEGERADREMQCDASANALADALATTNPRFDRAKFLTACGVVS